MAFLGHPDPSFRARQERLWRDALDEIRRSTPDFVVGQCSGRDPWELAVKTGALDQTAVQQMLDELDRRYEARWVGSTLVWVAPRAFKP